MANQHKIVIWVKPKRYSCDVEMSAHGNIFRLNLAGYKASAPNSTIPSTATEKAYVTAILNDVIAALT